MMLNKIEQIARDNNLPVFAEAYKKMIGEGGFGVVYESVYKGLKVAIKDMKDIKVLSDVKKEINNLVRVRHPNIPRLYGLTKSKLDDGIAFTMEYVKGRNIDEIFKNRTLSELEKLIFYYEIAKTMEYVHASGLIHRDLKPENLMVIEDNLSLRLLDFGIAKRTVHEETKTVIIGTPRYMAPENYVVYFGTGESRALIARTTVSTKNDIWAIGLIISELHSGKVPWDKCPKNDPKTLMMRGSNFPIPEELTNTSIRSLISECTTFSPNKRCDIELMKWKIHLMIYRLITEKGEEILKKDSFPDLNSKQCKTFLKKTI